MIFSTYAYIDKGKIMQLSAWKSGEGDYSLSNERAKAIYGIEAFAVDVTNIPVSIGDEYVSGDFYRVIGEEKTLISPQITIERQIEMLTERVAKLEEKL